MEEDGHTTQPILLQTPTKVLALLRCRVLIFPFFVALIVIGPSPDYVLLYSNGSPVFLFTLSSTLSIERKLWNHRAGLIYSSVICQSHDHGKSYTFSYFFHMKNRTRVLAAKMWCKWTCKLSICQLSQYCPAQRKVCSALHPWIFHINSSVVLQILSHLQLWAACHQSEYLLLLNPAIFTLLLPTVLAFLFLH